MHAPDFWYPKQGRLTRTGFFLAPIGWIYHFAGRLRRALSKSQHVDVPVVCLGNLTAGGTGKTPLCLSLAMRLSEDGYTVHFLTRGYGGSESGPVQVDKDVHTASEVGDEALLLANAATTWVSVNRFAGAMAAQKAGADLILMDDGFQNPSLEKDFSILAIESGYGFGNGQIIPAGPLREFVKGGLARADAIILTGGQSTLPIKLTEQLAASGLPVFNSSVVPENLTPALPADEASRLVAFSGIGRPQKFFDLLGEHCGDIVEAVPFPDHHVFSSKDLDFLRKLAEERKARLVTTTKDLVRLPSEFRQKVHVLPIHANIEDEERLIVMIKEKLASTSK